MKRLFLLSLCISVLLMVSGCNTVYEAEDAFNGFMVAVGICDFDSALNYIDKDKYEENFSLYIDNQMYLSKFFDDMSYEIISSQKLDSNTVQITAKITAIDMKPVLHTLYEESVKLVSKSNYSDFWVAEEQTTARMEKLLGRIASDSELSTISEEHVVKVVNKDGKWLVEPDAGFMATVSGDFEKAFASFADMPAVTSESEPSESDD